MFITFEGLDFCGKSTQVELLQEYLEKLGESVIIIREPGGVKISEKIRELLLDHNNFEMFHETELLLFAASRAQLVRETIIKRLKENKIVISDRFHDSSIAYQGFGREIDTDFVIDLQKFAVGEAIPDITFFLDIPVSEVFERKKQLHDDKLDRIERSQKEFYEKVREGYDFLSKTEERFVKLDGLMGIKEIHNEIVQRINKVLKG
jgi:dTMP kinase